MNDEIGTNRYALLFKPGVYGTEAQPIQIKVGYYTEIAGLGASADFWAVSMRRVNITDANLSLMDYCTAGPQYASGGFIADSNLPFVINGSQQQWLIRNSKIGGWSNGGWNQVFAGVDGAPPDAAFPTRLIPPSTPRPSVARSPTCSSTQAAATTSACRWRKLIPAASLGGPA